MQKNTSSKYLIIFGFVIIAITAVLFLQQTSSSVAEETAMETPAAVVETVTEKKSAIEQVIEDATNPKKPDAPKLFDMYAATAERGLGDEKAPITVIEYASMTCSHCASFHTTTFSDVKKQYIDTGKVYWIFRDYPLDKLALRASMMTRCVQPTMYFNLVEVLFNSQSRWVGSEEPLKAIEKTGRLAGMTPELFEECVNNTELEVHLLKTMQVGQSQWTVKSTPTFVINYGEETMSGARKIEEFKEIFDKLLQKHGVE